MKTLLINCRLSNFLICCALSCANLISGCSRPASPEPTAAKAERAQVLSTDQEGVEYAIAAKLTDPSACADKGVGLFINGCRITALGQASRASTKLSPEDKAAVDAGKSPGEFGWQTTSECVALIKATYTDHGSAQIRSRLRNCENHDKVRTFTLQTN